jgi:hypothetical protein
MSSEMGRFGLPVDHKISRDWGTLLVSPGVREIGFVPLDDPVYTDVDPAAQKALTYFPSVTVGLMSCEEEADRQEQEADGVDLELFIDADTLNAWPDAIFKLCQGVRDITPNYFLEAWERAYRARRQERMQWNDQIGQQISVAFLAASTFELFRGACGPALVGACAAWLISAVSSDKFEAAERKLDAAVAADRPPQALGRLAARQVAHDIYATYLDYHSFDWSEFRAGN